MQRNAAMPIMRPVKFMIMCSNGCAFCCFLACYDDEGSAISLQSYEFFYSSQILAVYYGCSGTEKITFQRYNNFFCETTISLKLTLML